jgi:hypothetical protein
MTWELINLEQPIETLDDYERLKALLHDVREGAAPPVAMLWRLVEDLLDERAILHLAELIQKKRKLQRKIDPGLH